MASTEAPTIFLVPGAVTTPACYDLIKPYLQDAGYPVATAALPSSNPADPDSCTADKDGQTLLNEHLLPLIDAGKDVVVFAHSFGATCLSGASRRLSKAQRTKDGKTGGILGLVYNSFALVPNGMSQFDYLGGTWPPFVRKDHPSPGLFVFHPVIDMLFNDADPSKQEEFAAGHTPHSINTIATPVSDPLWADPALEGRRIAIKTTLDNIFPAAAQQQFLDSSGVDWNVVDVEGGHEAFMTKPAVVAKIIVDAAKSWS